MSKRPSSERELDEDEEDLGLLQGGVRKMRLEHDEEGSGHRLGKEAAAAYSPKKKFNLLNVMEAIVDVTNWRDLGLQLGLSSTRLNECDLDGNPKQRMITQWMKDDPDASWEKLQEALITPAMCENRVAKGIADRRGSSFDKQVILELQSKCSTANSDALKCTEANVRNAVASVANIRELGERLKIPQSQLEYIDDLPPEHRKQKLVELWFKVDTDPSWETLTAAMKVFEWKVSKSMSDSFTESSLLSPTKSNGSRTNSISEAIAGEELKFQKAAEKKNTSMIRQSYSKLKRNVAKNLTGVIGHEGMTDFQEYILDLFDAGDSIQGANGVREVFRVLTEKKYWNFMDVSNLESIVEECGGEVKKECLNMIDQYKEELKGFKAAIKIAEFIEDNKSSESGQYASLKEDKDRYDVKYRTKLSIQLAGDKNQISTKISLESLFYVEKLWDSLCLDFNLPSLPHVLDDIVNGSIIIHWIIQHKLTWKILEQIGGSVKFFEREVITNVCLEGVCVYNQKKGIRTQKVCYVKLLVTVQEGKEVEKSFIQECFPDINAPIDELGRTALLLAARHGHTILMKPLLGHGADIYHRDKNGDSVLSLSKSNNDLHNRLQSKCEAVMITAAKEKDLPLLKRALDFGVDANAREEDSYGWTALLWACDNSHADVVDFLLQHGADIDAQDSEEWTGLILSSRRGKVDIVNTLLKNGADIHHLTNTRWNALMWAAQEGHAEVARLLLERGAESVEDDVGFTPLLQASQDGHLGVVKALVEHDPEMGLDETSKWGWTAIMIATKNGHEEIIRYLVEKGSDVNYQKEDEITALHIAGFKGHNSIVRYFCLAQKMRVNIQDKDGITPLMFAVKQGRVEVVRTLVENGRADVNIKENAFKWTALFFAVNERRPGVLDYLLRSERVDVKHVDDLGHSIVDLARKVYPDALEYLSKYHKAETETMTRAPPKQFTMAPYQVMLDKVSRTIGDNIKARPEVQVGAA